MLMAPFVEALTSKLGRRTYVFVSRRCPTVRAAFRFLVEACHVVAFQGALFDRELFASGFLRVPGN